MKFIDTPDVVKARIASMVWRVQARCSFASDGSSHTEKAKSVKAASRPPSAVSSSFTCLIAPPFGSAKSMLKGEVIGAWSLKESDRPPLDVPEAELPSGGAGLAEEFPGPLCVTGQSADEEHPSPLQPSASQSGGGLDPFVSAGGGGETVLGVVELADGGGQQAEVVEDRTR